MTDQELNRLLALHTVSRWQIVEMTRQQSVPEHSYRVWLLATHLYDTIFITGHNTFEQAMVGHWALMHDVTEIITGDIPSTVKELMEEIEPGLGQKLNTKVIEKNFPSVRAKLRGIERTLGYYVVKIADIVEAILYLRAYISNRDQLLGIETNRREALWRIMDHAKTAFKTVDWKQAEIWLVSRLGYDSAGHKHSKYFNPDPAAEHHQAAVGDQQVAGAPQPGLQLRSQQEP